MFRVIVVPKPTLETPGMRRGHTLEQCQANAGHHAHTPSHTLSHSIYSLVKPKPSEAMFLKGGGNK